MRPYLQLLRAPNLFTVPGDPLCGYLLASNSVWSWRVFLPVLISVSAYCFGLILNDLADLPEDLRDRPQRPLPSAAISPQAARCLAVLCASVALAVAAVTSRSVLWATLLLLAVIVLYNYAAKKSPVFGPIFMGLCRALSVLLGALAFGMLPAGPAIVLPADPAEIRPAVYDAVNGIHVFASHFSVGPLPLLAAIIIGLYILCVTTLARTEVNDPRIPPLIGTLIRGLLLIQAVFCALSGDRPGWMAAGVLLALWPISRLVGRYFYAS